MGLIYRAFATSVIKRVNKQQNIITVFHKLPFTYTKTKDGIWIREPSTHRLVTTLQPVLSEYDGIWVGWGGLDYNPTAAVPNAEPNGVGSNKVFPVIIDENLHKKFYQGYCHGTIWPMFHSMADHAKFKQDYWEAYVTANEHYGEAAASAILETSKHKSENDDITLVWFNDYELLLAPVTVRRKISSVPTSMGFFLHTPFPQWEVFRLIPWANLMLQGILECDVIGFNAKRYCLNFMDCCRESLGCKIDVDSGTVIHVGRTIKVVHNPIGVSNRDLENLARESPDLELSKNLVILGVDRLDYIRGVPYKLNAFERFLEMYPEFLEKVVLLQILIPSRTSQAIYQELKKTIDKLVGRINGKFGTHDWVPIQYIYKFILPKELAGYYRDSHVYFFTPLSDGMNLRGKEYVASQIKSSPGVLIMSQFSGAEEEMKEALFCNPHDITETAETLKRGLTMSEDERVLRMNNLRRRGKKYDIQYWKENFMKAMNKSKEVLSKSKPTHYDRVSSILKNYCEFEKKDKLALVLDYEGTMVPILENGEVEKLPAKTKQLIEKLSSYKDVHLTIISEGDIENLKKLIGCDNIIYAGHNGLQINIPNGTKFTHIELTNLHKKISSLAVSLKKNTSTSKATIINKGCYLIFNYQNIPEELQEYTVQVAGGIIKKNKFEVTPGPKCLYARLRLGWSKGRAVIFILTQIFGYDWDDNVKVIYAGNDQNDEEVFRVLNGLAKSFQVSYTPLFHASADGTLPDTKSIFVLLQWVDQYFSQKQN